MTQKKAFLSHSSRDKATVRPVFERLTAAHCHYDEQTFEQAYSSAEAIFKGVKQCDVFALFVSPASIESAWVQHEMKLAHQFYAAGCIRKIFVFFWTTPALMIYPSGSKSSFIEKLVARLSWPMQFERLFLSLRQQINPCSLSF